LFYLLQTIIIQENGMGRLEGKTVVITGGNSGIGLATAERFVAEGAHVFIVGRRQSELDKAVGSIGGDITAIQGDVSILGDIDRVFATVSAVKGHVDILFANAGLGELAPLGQITEAQFDKTFDVNVKGTLFTVQKALPLMKAGGSIILTGSTTGVTGTPAFSVYSASKAAIRNFVRSWALDLKGTGIRVNVISPGPTSTPGLHGIASSPEEDKALMAGLIAQTPLGRIGRPEEIAAAALFLASEDSSFMTGSEIFVDGGQGQI
jgi:NAD(P)-dependent dehydrogenase (short-subunit alcohol dehydrogenase family)